MRMTRVAVLALAITSIVGCSQSHAPEACGHACEPCCAHETCLGGICAGGTCAGGVLCDAGPRPDVGPGPDGEALPDAGPPPGCGRFCEPCCPGDVCFGGACSGPDGTCRGGIPCDAGMPADAAAPHDALSRADAGSACAQIDALDRHCTSDTDCDFAIHAADCCGTYAAIGFAASEADEYAALEPICVASYPACGCAARPTMTDSDELLTSPSDGHVACVTRGTGAVCLTYVAMRPPNGR
jgi:hypothetical protein